jgi:hypothetical protein
MAAGSCLNHLALPFTWPSIDKLTLWPPLIGRDQWFTWPDQGGLSILWLHPYVEVLHPVELDWNPLVCGSVLHSTKSKLSAYAWLKKSFHLVEQVHGSNGDDPLTSSPHERLLHPPSSCVLGQSFVPPYITGLDHLPRYKGGSPPILPSFHKASFGDVRSTRLSTWRDCKAPTDVS